LHSMYIVHWRMQDCGSDFIFTGFGSKPQIIKDPGPAFKINADLDSVSLFQCLSVFFTSKRGNIFIKLELSK